MLYNRFSDEAAVEREFIAARWPNGIACPMCGSLAVTERRTRKPPSRSVAVTAVRTSR